MISPSLPTSSDAMEIRRSRRNHLRAMRSRRPERPSLRARRSRRQSHERRSSTRRRHASERLLQLHTGDLSNRFAQLRVRAQLADFVAEVFCPSECVRLIQDQASMRNVDSRIHSVRFDCCVFLFYSFSAVTFATKSAHRVNPQQRSISVAFGVTRTLTALRTEPDL